MTIHVPSHPSRKLGLRLVSRHRTSLPSFAEVQGRLGVAAAAAPVTFDYTGRLPSDTGVLGNDRMGNCACAGLYHRMQLVDAVRQRPAPPQDVLAPLAIELYREFGYDPAETDSRGENPTDQGCAIDQVAEFLISGGLLLPDGSRERFVAALDVDPRSEIDLAICGQQCLGLGFGVVITDAVMPRDGSPIPKVWHAGGEPLGGHYVFAGARAADGTWTVNSWGEQFQLAPDFIRANLEQAVAYVAIDALANGLTVLGATLEQWQAAMASHGRPVR